MRVKSNKNKKSKIAVNNKKVQETTEHNKLKLIVAEIINTCGFKLDTEIAINFSGNRNEKGELIDERSMDVVAYGNTKNKRFLIIFECKGGSDIKGIQSKISSWEADIEKVKKGEAKVIYSDHKAIKDSDFKGVDEIRVCYVFGDSITPERFESIESIVKGRKFFAWSINGLTYFKKTASTVGKAVKYEILREFEISLESSGQFSINAIQIRQGDMEMFVFGALPSVLLKIGYVYRRASGKPLAYQRILNKDRITKISEFLSENDALLPNAIIIAFDNDADVQKAIKYENGKLHFPRRYGSAWIIDGQHRIFGFLDTPHEDVDEDDPNLVFELPVVAFRNLEAVWQNRTFVNINYNQKKIDPTLLCDLATALPDLQNELTWPSLLVSELAKLEPLKGKVKISEFDKGRPISIATFARYGLLEGLLGYDKKKRTYEGALNKFSPFKPKAILENQTNRNALNEQVELLRRYFVAVAENTSKKSPKKDPWQNTKDYALLKPTGINALLLALSRIMEKYPNLEAGIRKDLASYLKPIGKVSFTRTFVAKQGGGWKGFRKLANVILEKINSENGDDLRLFGEKDKQ